MKRLLSILLAIMMVATLLPTAAFAAEGEAVETPETGIRIKYDILGAITKLGLFWESSSSEAAAVKRVPMTVIDFGVTDGFFNFKNSSRGIFTGHSELNYNASYGFQISSGDWVEFDIFVPKAGTYTMEMWCGNFESDTKTRVYIDGVEVGRYSNYEEGTINGTPAEGQNQRFTKVVDEPRYIEGITFEKAGLHTVRFHGNSNYCSAGTFYLVENGTGTGTCFATIVATADRTILSYGSEQTAKIDTKLFMSDGSAADTSAYPVSFRSDNTAVANVSAAGVVTPVGAGVANITAYATNEFGEEVFATKEITVVDDITIKYDVIKHLYTDLGYNDKTAVADGSLNKLDETVTDGFYSYAGGTAYDANSVKYYDRVQLMGAGAKMAFKINVPKAGLYAIEVDAIEKYPKTEPARANVDMNVYITKDEISSYPKDKAGSYNCYVENGVDGKRVRKYICAYNFDEAGDYIINFVVGSNSQKSPYSYVGSFYLVGGTKSALMNGKISSTASSINKDENETATVSATGFLSSTAEAATFTYTSSNTDIATVDAETGLVTPLKEGKVTITATANADVANTLTTDITVTVNKPGEAIADTMVNVGIEAMTGGAVETNLAEVISEVEIGTEVSAKAIAADGYEFAYWADSTGKVLSTKAEETFKINVNTSVKAYFEKIPVADAITAPVYFYNGNRDLIEKKEVDKGTEFSKVKIAAPTLTGFEFTGWSIDDATIINNITRAVALFKDTDKTYTVKVGDKEVASGKKYGESVTVSSDAENFVCWKLGEKVMSYEKTFKFDVYGDITLTEVTGEPVSAVPTVVLDIVGGEYFLTYNVPAGYKKIEAGILFSESGKPDIGSFYSKATEKTGSGQFTAMPNGTKDTIARGYMIFRDADNSIRVIYAD